MTTNQTDALAAAKSRYEEAKRRLLFHCLTSPFDAAEVDRQLESTFVLFLDVKVLDGWGS